MLDSIILLRIYDVLMALLQSTNPQMAEDLLRLHAEGKLLGSNPSFDGHFMTDEALGDL